jgi:hypothetical protein
MTQRFQNFTKRYVNVLGVLIRLAVVGSILLNSGCGMTGSPNTPRPTPTPDLRPTSTITSPTTGGIVTTGATVNITGTASAVGGRTLQSVQVSVDGGATYSPATGTTAWSFVWSPSLSGQTTIKSRASDTSGGQQDPPAEVTVTVRNATPLTSTITSPKTGAAVLIGTTVSVTGTARNVGAGSVARVDVSVDGGATFSAATGTTAWSFSWTPTTPGRATIRSRAVDSSGNVQNPPAEITVTRAVGGTWTAQGPGPTRNGQVENIPPNNEVVGAIQAVAPHPTDSNILYVGGVNGGIWRTRNATAASPDWTPLTDNFPSLSIGALEFDPTDATHQTLVAGIGRFSSFDFNGGPQIGIFRTTDGGDNWTQISHPLLINQNISGVAARGSTLLASSTVVETSTGSGLFRSIDGGINWALVSGGNGLAAGGIFDLAGDPSDPNRFYVSVQKIGIFGSKDGGATWTNISSGDPTLNGVIAQNGNNNARMSVGSNGRLYVIVAVVGQAQYIGYTDNPTDAAPAWTAMDLPQTRESDGHIVGLNPAVQGIIHLSITADPNNLNTVYVAGDHQDGPFPNFIGANDFSGRLFRGNTTVASTGAVPSPQWQHLTNLNSIAQIPGGGTAHNSSPHADSRKLVIDAGGDLINVNDGGVYRRASPQNNTGDWFSINGNIQTTEFHSVAYDTISNVIIIGGAQDTGTPEQSTPGSTTWDSVSTGDGGDVAVDNISLASSGRSIRYSSLQSLMDFRREVYDATNKLISITPITPTVEGGGDPLKPQFVTPVQLNAIDPTRLVIAGSNAVYESLTRGDKITQITGPGTSRDAIAYGGSSGGVANSDVLYVGSGSAVFLRTTAGAALAPTTALPTGASDVRDVALDPDDWKSAYVVDSSHVFRTTDAGGSWTDITGNLAEFGAGDFNTNAFVAGAANKLLLVGTNAGVFVSYSASGFTHWDKLGAGLPNVLVLDLAYDVADDVLLAGTLGRGAWAITNLRNLTQPAAQP